MNNHENVKISIIMPTYNVGKYVDTAIRSVLEQDFQDFELICIDNASIDNETEQIIERYAQMDSRVLFVRNEKNEGISYSRNRGIKLARGEYILFLDADDRLVKNALNIVYKNVSNNNVDILFFDAITEYETEELKERFGKYKPNRKGKFFTATTGPDLFVEFIREDRYSDVLWRQCFKRQFLSKAGLEFGLEKLHEDVLFSYKAILTASSVLCIREEIYIYYRRNDSLTSGEKRMDGFKSEFQNYCNMLRFWHKNVYNDSVNEAVAAYLNNYFAYVRKHYKEVLTDVGMAEMSKVVFENAYDNHLYASLLLNTGKVLNFDKKEIFKYKKIIVYGAGMYAEALLQELFTDKIIGIAVTDMANNPMNKFGYQVHELDYYGEYTKEALVIVAVAPKSQDTIISNLEAKGFEHYICIGGR